MNKIEKLVKIADRLDQKGKFELADKVDAVINKLSCETCGCEANLDDSDFEHDTTDDEIEEFWEEESND